MGHTSAMTSLGVLFSEGKGTEAKPAEAARLFLMASKAGVPQAMLNLSMLYREGRGVEQNEAEAYFWAKNGANSLTDDMRENALAMSMRLGAKLDPEMRAQIDARHTEWLAREILPEDRAANGRASANEDTR